MVPQLMPIIDPRTVYCNNTISTQNVIGISSAVTTTVRKLIDVLREQGESALLVRHLELIGLRMGAHGELDGANVKGLQHSNPMTAAKFEKLVATLVNNSLRGRECTIDSVSAMNWVNGRRDRFTHLVTPDIPDDTVVQEQVMDWMPGSPRIDLGMCVCVCVCVCILTNMSADSGMVWEPASPNIKQEENCIITCDEF